MATNGDRNLAIDSSCALAAGSLREVLVAAFEMRAAFSLLAPRRPQRSGVDWWVPRNRMPGTHVGKPLAARAKAVHHCP